MEQFKKLVPIGVKILKGLLIMFAVSMMIFTVLTVNNKDKGFLGFKFYTVLSDSMKPEFQSGDIIISKIIKPDMLKEGDIITFRSKHGEIVTHKIIDKSVDNSEEVFITKGINVDQQDLDPVSASNVMGKYSFSIPKAGLLFNFIQKPVGFISLVFIPLLLLLLYNGYNLVKAYIVYKNKQFLDEKNQLIKEKLENEKIREEIKFLKEQLTTGNNG